MLRIPVSFMSTQTFLTKRCITVQHWHIYRRWNTCLFQELYKAYKEGRMEKDPSENWYEGELGFFGKFEDNYRQISGLIVLRQIITLFRWQRS